MIGVMIFAGCATKRVGIDEERAATKYREVLVRQVEYGAKGLPIFLNQLGYRPSKTGDRFTLVQLTNDRPVLSFDIAVVGPNADFTKPFKVVYEWTGKGFQVGAGGSIMMADIAPRASGSVHNGNDAVIMIAVILVPMVAGTAGGFVIGVADGIKTVAQEAGKVVLGNYEEVATYTTYTYDVHDRLVLMRMYKAGAPRQELVRTEYTYKDDSPDPVKTVITTYPGGKVKTLE
jgi:hypothetical protein